MFECILSLLQAARNTDLHQRLLLGHATCTRAAAKLEEHVPSRIEENVEENLYNKLQ